MTSKNEIRNWLQDAREYHTHMIVVCDTFDHEDYPVYVSHEQNVEDIVKKYNGREMQRIMEVYDLSEDHEEQVNSVRAFNL